MGEKSKGLWRSKGDSISKIYSLLEALGNHGEHRNEIVKAEELVENIYNATVIADKAYDSSKFRDHLKEKMSTCYASTPKPQNTISL